MNSASALESFNTQSFFILTNLPKNSEFGFDGKVFVVDKFNGVKLIPAGLHLFLFSPAPKEGQTSNRDGPENVSNGIGIRQGFFKFFDRIGEVVVEEWDQFNEELVSDREEVGKMRSRVPIPSESIENLISLERLKGLDSTLAAYPTTLAEGWSTLTSFITPITLARTIGLNERGNARIDAVMGSTKDEEELAAAGGKQSWGKLRDDDDLQTGTEPEAEEELLRFLRIEEKKSWPVGAVGMELSKWSKDKSWVLSDVIKTQLGGGSKAVQEFLGEFQLAFVLFTLLHNFSSLTIYKSIISILCKSITILQPISSRTTGLYSASLLGLESLPLYCSFFSILYNQLNFLDEEFFSVQMPGLDIFLLTSLDTLSTSLSEVSTYYHVTSTSTSAPEIEIWKELIKRWNDLTQLSMKKFGWELNMIKGSRGIGITKPQEREDEVDLEDLEEGEDAPVIVEM